MVIPLCSLPSEICILSKMCKGTLVFSFSCCFFGKNLLPINPTTTRKSAAATGTNIQTYLGDSVVLLVLVIFNGAGTVFVGTELGTEEKLLDGFWDDSTEGTRDGGNEDESDGEGFVDSLDGTSDG